MKTTLKTILILTTIMMIGCSNNPITPELANDVEIVTTHQPINDDYTLATIRFSGTLNDELVLYYNQNNAYFYDMLIEDGATFEYGQPGYMIIYNGIKISVDEGVLKLIPVETNELDLTLKFMVSGGHLMWEKTAS